MASGRDIVHFLFRQDYGINSRGYIFLNARRKVDAVSTFTTVPHDPFVREFCREIEGNCCQPRVYCSPNFGR